MAISSQSGQHQYKDYVNPLDLNIFASVMQHQQHKFDQGASAVQSKIDGFASLDVLADEDKQYVNQKLQETLKGINTLGGADLSDSSVVQQLSGYVGTIGKDGRVINAVMDTKKVRAVQTGRAQINKDFNAGKKGVFRSDSNEDIENSAVQEYLTKKKADPNARYEGPSSVISYSDFHKRLSDAASKMKASGYSRIQGTDNKYMYVNIEGKVLSEEDIWDAASKSLSEEDRNQMARDAKYHYKSASDQQILTEFNEANTRKVKELEHSLNDAVTRYGAATPEVKERIQKQIDTYNKKIAETTDKIRKGIVNNREAVVGSLFESRYLEGLSKRYSYSEEKQRPFWNQGAMHQEKLSQEQSQFNVKIKNDNDNKTLDRALAREKMNNDASRSDGTGKPQDQSTVWEENSLSNEKKDNTTQILRDENVKLSQEKEIIKQQMYNEYANTHDPDGIFFNRIDGKAVPTEKWKQLNPKLVKAADDIANGRQSELGALPEEFAHSNKKLKDIETKQKANEFNISAVMTETMKRTKAHLAAHNKGLTDDQWAAYERGKNLREKLNEATPKKTNQATTAASNPGQGWMTFPTYSNFPEIKLSASEQKDLRFFNSKEGEINSVIAKNREKVENDISTRLTYTGVTLNNAQLKSKGLLNGILLQRNGYYAMGSNNKIEKQNETNKEVLTEDNFEALGSVKRDFNGVLQNYVVGNLKSKDDDDKTTAVQIYVPIDESLNKSLATSIVSPAEHVQALVKASPTHDYYGRSYAAPIKGQVYNIVDYRVVESRAGVYRVQIKQPYDEKGKPLSKPVMVNINRTLPTIDAAYSLAETLAQQYQTAQQAAKARGENLSFRDFVRLMP